MKKILVTGDRGYIGSSLVPLLINRGYEVIGLDTNFFGYTIPENYLGPKYKQISKDIRKVSGADLVGVDAIIHLSALSNDPMGELDENLTSEINFESTIKLAKLAYESGVKRFIFSSSCSIYGIAKTDVVSEKSEVNPLTAYAKSKIQSEEVLKKLSSENFCICLPRNSTVYGYSPVFRNDLVVNNMTFNALTLGKIKVLSDGSPWRPLIDVRDLSSVFVSFLEKDSKAVNGKVINVGFKSNNLQVKNVVETIHNVLPKSEVEYVNEHGKDTRSYKVDFSLFEKIFPDIKQEWNVDKSVRDLVRILIETGFEGDSSKSAEFSRINVLKSLLDSGKIDKELFWKNQ